MKIKFLLPILAIVFIAAGCNKSPEPAATNNNTNPIPAPSQSPAPTPTPVPVGNSGTAIVSITSSGFSPANITVKKGTKVDFVNNDTRLRWPASAPHPTHTDYPQFDPKKGFAANTSWSFTFDKVGTWKYHDHLLPTQFGSITVVE